MPPEIEQRIEDCWREGMSIGATIIAVERSHRQRLDFSTVHQRFVALSWRIAA